MTEAQDLHKQRAEHDEWEDEPADVRVRPSTTEVVSFRLASEELDRVQEAATRRGVSVSELIRSALKQALDGGSTTGLDDVSIGPIKVFLGAEWSRRMTRPSASGDLVPDYPPSSQNVTSSEGAERLDDVPRLPLEA